MLTHWWKTLQMWYLWSTVLNHRYFTVTYSHSYWWETTQMWNLWITLHTDQSFTETCSHSYWWETGAGSIPDSYDFYRYLNLVRYSIFDTRYFRRKCNFVYIFRGYFKRLRHKKKYYLKKKLWDIAGKTKSRFFFSKMRLFSKIRFFLSKIRIFFI